MAEVGYMHICDYAFNAEKGKPCIIGIFDQISAPQFPATHPYMVVGIQFSGQPHELVAVTVELGRPNGDVLTRLNGQINVSPEGGAFLIVNFVGIQFPEQGRYTVKVLSAGRTLATQSLRLRRQEAQPPPPAQVH